MTQPEPSTGISTFTRFLAGGGSATALHWGLMALLIALGTNAGAATAAGATLGAASNYMLQFHVTFRARTPHCRALPAYVAVAAASWLVNLLIFMALHAGLACTVPLAQLSTTALVALLNFWLYRTVVFHEKPIATVDS